MQNKLDKLEIARQQILEPNFCKTLPVFYSYTVCKYLQDSVNVVPYNHSEQYNTGCYGVTQIYKPILNNVLTFNDNERDSL